MKKYIKFIIAALWLPSVPVWAVNHHQHTMDMSDMDMSQMSDADMQKMHHQSMTKTTTASKTTAQAGSHSAAITPSMRDADYANGRVSHMQHAGHSMDAGRIGAFNMKHFESNVSRSDTHDNDTQRTTAYDLDAWYGTDKHKILLRSEGHVGQYTFWTAQNDLLWQTALTPFWNVEMGVRSDLVHDRQISERAKAEHWLALGLSGILPYEVDTAATFYLNKNNMLALKVHAEYHLRLTQKLILQPKVELILNSKADLAQHIYQGLASYTGALRLHYQVTPQLSPYIGWLTEKDKANDEKQSKWLAGVSFWF